MGFGYPKEQRDALVAAEPAKFSLPRQSDLRFNWVRAELAALEPAEMRELVVDAWRMVVPKFVARDHLAATAGRMLHVLDMDGTLLPGTSAALEIARATAGGDWVRELERRFTDGGLTTAGFAAELHRRWSDLTPADVESAFTHAPVLAGVERTVAEIHAGGGRAVVVTMSPNFFADRWLRYGFDAVVASRFPALPFPPLPAGTAFDAGGILTFADKPRIAQELAERYGFTMADLCAYGDSQSDVDLFAVSGVSVAVNADQHVRHLADVHYTGNDLYAAYQLGRRHRLAQLGA
jgi:phosphoserine phosphatase